MRVAGRSLRIQMGPFLRAKSSGTAPPDPAPFQGRPVRPDLLALARNAFVWSTALRALAADGAQRFAQGVARRVKAVNIDAPEVACS